MICLGQPRANIIIIIIIIMIIMIIINRLASGNPARTRLPVARARAHPHQQARAYSRASRARPAIRRARTSPRVSPSGFPSGRRPVGPNGIRLQRRLGPARITKPSHMARVANMAADRAGLNRRPAGAAGSGRPYSLIRADPGD